MANEKQGEQTFTDREKMEAAYALNLCTVSVSQIVDYNDIYILEQEYDAILNNLNIQNIIHDEALLSVLKQILDTITFFKIQEGDKKFIEKEYQAKMKSAIWSAIPNLSVIIAGGNPVTAAIGIATQIGIGYMAYRKTTGEANLAQERAKWELQRAAIEQFSALQRELFSCAWRLSDKYDFEDRYRLTEKQIKHYNTILMDSDPMRRYERLDTQKQVFEAFPPFWYYKGNAAKEVAAKYAHNADITTAYKAKALEDYRKFDEIYVELMREDIIAASCALEHIALLDRTKDVDEIRKLLERVAHLAGDNFDVLQLVVLNYIALDEKEKARDILRRLVNEDYNVSFNGLLLSRIYCRWNKNKVEFDILRDRIGDKNVIPWIEDDGEADKKYISDCETDVLSQFNSFIDCVILKYRKQYYAKFQFDDSQKVQKQAEWAKGADITQFMVDTMNDMFKELKAFELFSIHKRLENKSWLEYFKEISIPISAKINNFNKTRMNVLKKISENANNPNVLKGTVEALFTASNFSVIASDFTEGIKAEFKRTLTVESITNLQDNLPLILEQWYIENEITFSENDDAEQAAEEVFGNYFTYPEEV
ncbi:hypothetical protein AGMMS49579_09220 [Spirochaetia bacterium]|nr:hypothetical protein AGMMS49579_09220 [Spirochaetia bacterium]